MRRETQFTIYTNLKQKKTECCVNFLKYIIVLVTLLKDVQSNSGIWSLKIIQQTVSILEDLIVSSGLALFILLYYCIQSSKWFSSTNVYNFIAVYRYINIQHNTISNANIVDKIILYFHKQLKQHQIMCSHMYIVIMFLNSLDF